MNRHGLNSNYRVRTNGIRDFKVTDVTYHRNGICGRPFHSVRFSYTEDGRFMPNMLATVPAEATDHPGGRECFVIDLANPTACWRGDAFAELVHSAVKEYQSESESKFRALMKSSSKTV